MLKIESGLVLLALLIAGIYPALGRAWFEKLERRFSALARRRTLSVAPDTFAHGLPQDCARNKRGKT